jgi:hypothetical protein
MKRIIVDEEGHPLQGSGVNASATFEPEGDPPVEPSDVYTDEVALRGRFNVTVSGTFVATVTLQRSYDGGATWHDRKVYTSAADEVLEETEYGVLYRIGIKTGEFTSGSVDVRIGQ